MKDVNGKGYKVTMAVQLSQLGQMTSAGWVLLAIVKDTIVEHRNPVTQEVVANAWQRIYDGDKPITPIVVTRSVQMAVIGRDEASALAEADERVRAAQRETFDVRQALEDMSRKFAEADKEWRSKKEGVEIQKELNKEIERLRGIVELDAKRLRAIKQFCGERDVADALEEAGLH